MPRRRSSRRSRSLLRALLPSTPKRRRPRALRRPAAVAPRPQPARGPGRWVSGPRPGPGGRSYDVYLPARLRTGAPLVMLLHGCRQTPAEFADATRFTTVADRNGLVLVLPHQESRHQSQRCWRWYDAAHQHRDAGEPGALAAIVWQVLAEHRRWRVDPHRVYVAGLSAGGAMALTLAATYPDVFAAAGVHSAPAYRSATHSSQALGAMVGRTPVPRPVGDGPAMAPVLVVQGTADDVVRAANGDRIADQWLAFRAAAGVGAPDPGRIGRTRTDSGRTPDGRRYTRVRWYTVRGRRVLEYWMVDGLRHAWSGGRAGGSYSDPAGPRAATLMWGFFRIHRLDGVAGPTATAAGA